MGWFDKSPEQKAFECKSCFAVLHSGEKYKVCDKCGHLYFDTYCSCEL